MTYLALLRGINVGGANKVRMADLKACMEKEGFAEVETYIASGNVIFDAGRAAQAALAERIEKALARTFDYEARIVLRSHKQLKAIVAGAPKGFGGQPGTFHYDVIFLKERLTAAKAMKKVPTRDGVDQVDPGPSVLYFARLSSRLSQSYISRLAGSPIYREMTVRTWRTTTKLLALMDAREG